MAEAGLRGALIGCGFFARNHLHAWRDIEGVELVAVSDLDEAKARRAADVFGVARHYTEAEAMFRGEQLDFVDIATTVPSHRALVEMAARFRVPTICQKPFALTMEDAEAMVGACRAADVPLMVHENFRWQTPLMEVRKVIERGVIGRPFFGRVSWRTGYDVFANQPYLAEEERLIISDLGVHVLDTARFLFGEVRRIACATARVNPRVRGEDTATMLLTHLDGAVSVVDCSYATRVEPDPFPETLVEVDGERGSIRLLPGYAMVVHADGRTERRDVAPRLLPWATPPWHLVQESVLNIQRHWVECLRTGREPATSARDNMRTFALVEAAYEAAEKGRVVEMGGRDE